MDTFWVILGLVVILLFLLYSWTTRNHDHWAKKNIAHISPIPLFGNMAPTFFQRASFAEHLEALYRKLKKHKVAGVYEFNNPTMLITDPDLLRDITVKHFDHFINRRKIVGSDVDPLFARALSSLRDAKWREMRNCLSPAFTASKLRAMLPLIEKCSKEFANFLVNRPEPETSPVEFKGVLTRFTNDVIASVAFGQECNAIQEPDNVFYKYALELTTFKGVRMLILFAYMLFPNVMQFLRISFLPSSSKNFFLNLVNNAMEYRKKNNVTRPDMLQLLMDAQAGGIQRAYGDEMDVGTIGEDEEAAAMHHTHIFSDMSDRDLITEEDIAAQALVFYIAGFDTVATMLSFLAHELAVNPEIQERLRAEIDAKISANKGKLTYESIISMKYLDMVTSELLRKYPTTQLTDRYCVKNYKIPDTDIVIEEGTTVLIPIYPFQRDPDYFHHPERFDPERFNEENKKEIKPFTYIPFGTGPRNCIGMRFALLEVKMCICYLLATCQLRVCAKTEIPLQLSKTSFQMTTDAGFWLCAVPREEPSIDISNASS